MTGSLPITRATRKLRYALLRFGGNGDRQPLHNINAPIYQNKLFGFGYRIVHFSLLAQAFEAVTSL